MREGPCCTVLVAYPQVRGAFACLPSLQVARTPPALGPVLTSAPRCRPGRSEGVQPFEVASLPAAPQQPAELCPPGCARGGSVETEEGERGEGFRNLDLRTMQYVCLLALAL